MTIREQISQILATINTNFKTMETHECSELALVLSSLLSTVIEKEAEAEGKCNMYKIEIMETNEGITDAKATTLMKASTDWIEWQKLKALRVGVQEVIRSLKNRVKLKLEEQQTI